MLTRTAQKREQNSTAAATIAALLLGVVVSAMIAGLMWMGKEGLR